MEPKVFGRRPISDLRPREIAALRAALPAAEAQHRIDALEQAFAAEPIPWVELVVARARALVRKENSSLRSVLTRMDDVGLALGRAAVVRALDERAP